MKDRIHDQLLSFLQKDRRPPERRILSTDRRSGPRIAPVGIGSVTVSLRIGESRCRIIDQAEWGLQVETIERGDAWKMVRPGDVLRAEVAPAAAPRNYWPVVVEIRWLRETAPGNGIYRIGMRISSAHLALRALLLKLSA